MNNLIDSVFDKFPETGQNKIELLELSKIIHFHKPFNFLEIGTQYGGTFYLLSSLSSGKKISVDLIDGIHGGLDGDSIERRNLVLKSYFPDCHLLNLDSHSEPTLDTVKEILNGEKLDILFIDGDHSYSGVRKDFEMYKSLVRSGGMVVFHDINYIPQLPECEVYKFWNELFNCEEMKDRFKYELNCKSNWMKRKDFVLGGFGVIYI